MKYITKFLYFFYIILLLITMLDKRLKQNTLYYIKQTNHNGLFG